MLPLPHGAPPTEGEKAVGELPDRGFARSRIVARSGIKPTYQNRTETVPYTLTAKTSQRRGLLKLGHMPIWLGTGNIQPRPRHVPRGSGEQQRAHDREDGHRLRRAVDRGAPFLPEEEEDRRDQRPGVPDADPEHEVRDVPRPADGDVESPDANPLPEEPRDRHTEKAEEREGRDERATSRSAPVARPAPRRPR